MLDSRSMYWKHKLVKPQICLHLYVHIRSSKFLFHAFYLSSSGLFHLKPLNFKPSLCKLKVCLTESLQGSIIHRQYTAVQRVLIFSNIGYFWQKRIKCGKATALDWKCQVSTISFIMGWLWPQISVTWTMNGTNSQNIQGVPKKTLNSVQRLISRI